MTIDRNISIKSCRNCANLSKKIWHCAGCDGDNLWTPMEAPKTDYVGCSKKTPIKTTYSFPRIKKVLFKNPATIVFWDDNTKTVVKCSEHDDFDWEKGLAMAISKKFFGNEGNYYNNFKKWAQEEEKEEDETITVKFDIPATPLANLSREIDKFSKSIRRGLF